MNLYALLNIKSNASAKEIKNAYHRQIKKYNPNNDQSNAQIFTDIIFAYSILGKSSTKFVYDLLGPSNLNYMKTETTLKVLCTILNPVNAFLFGLSIVMLFTTWIFGLTGFYMMKFENLHYFITMLTINFLVIMLIIDLIVLRIMLKLRNYGIKIPNFLLYKLFFIEFLVISQLVLLLLRIDWGWNINMFITCIPYLFAELIICIVLSVVRKISFLYYLFPFLLRVVILTFWTFDFPALIKAGMVFIVFLQYLVLGSINLLVFFLGSSFYSLVIAPFLMMYYNKVDWYTFMPAVALLIMYMAGFGSLFVYRNKIHFYKKAVASVHVTYYLM